MDSGKRGEAADQRQAAAQLNTPRLCLDLVMMCAIKSWRDVGTGVWGACTRMRLQKIWLFFLCMRTHSVAEVCRVGRMLSHVPAHSLSLLSRGEKKKKKNHNNINTKRKKKGLALFPLSLSGCRPWGRGESESLYSSYFLPQTFSACQWKERERPSDPIPLWTDNTIILTQGLLIPRVR